MRVRICEDNPEFAKELVTEIRDVNVNNFDVEVDVIENMKEEISNLILRKIAVMGGQEDPSNIVTEFDAIDIMVIDYDLVHLDDGGGRTTGEGIARLARSYSQCGVVAVINQFKGPQFDLGMRGHLDSFADVNLDASLINTPALWQKMPATGEFNPTTWTPLPIRLNSACQLSKKLEQGGLDSKVSPLLGLDEDAINQFSDTAFGFLSTEAETSNELASVTVRSFLERSLGHNQVVHLSKYSAKYLYNFAAYRLIKWLDRAVLRPMDVLIDAPHLIDRLPFLMNTEKIDQSISENWAKAASQPTEFLYWSRLERFHNKEASKLLGRDIFNWHNMVYDEEIEQIQDEYIDQEDESQKFYLAEDTSRFVEIGALMRYRADFHNFGDRRGIEKLNNITYGPLRRMSFGWSDE